MRIDRSGPGWKLAAAGTILEAGAVAAR